MTDKINELMRLIDEYAESGGHLEREYLKSALEAALKPGEPVGYRYKFRNFMGDEVWSFELPRDGKVLEVVPVYLEPMPTWQPSDAFRNDAHIAFLHGVIEGQKTAPPAQTPAYINQAEAESHGYLSQPVTIRNPAQTPPPRLTAEQLTDLLCIGEHTTASTKHTLAGIARVIESAVRKQFLGDRDE